MPYQTFNAFNPQGTVPVMSDEERSNDRRSLANADNAFKQAMLNLEAQKIAQQGSQFDRGLTHDEAMQQSKFGQELKTMGSFDQKSAAELARLGTVNSGLADVARIGNEPQLATLGFDKYKYDTGRGDTAADRALHDKLMRYVATSIPNVQDDGFSTAIGGGAAGGTNAVPSWWKQSPEDAQTQALSESYDRQGLGYSINKEGPYTKEPPPGGMIAPGAPGHPGFGNPPPGVAAGRAGNSGQPDMKRIRAAAALAGINIPQSEDEIRMQAFEDKQVSAAFDKVKGGGPGAKQAQEFLASKGYDTSGGMFDPSAAEKRASADAITKQYLESPSIQGRVRSLVPALIEEAKINPDGISYAVQRAANALAMEAGKEGGDTMAVSRAVTKALAELLAPELDKVKPGASRTLLGAAFFGDPGAPYEDKLLAMKAKQTLAKGNF